MPELERLFVRVVGDISDLDKKLDRAQKLVRDFGAGAAGFGRALQLGVTLPLGVAAAASVKAAAEMDGLRRSLATVVGGTAEANRELDRLKVIARLPGLGFREAVRGAVQLNVALEGMNDRVELSNRLLTQFGNAIALTGGGAPELDRVIFQLGQIAAAGRVLTADLRPIIQTAPAVATALRRAFGTIDAQAIERMGLSTEEFFHRLLEGLEALPRASRSARTSFEDLSDSVFRLRAAIGDALLPVLEPLISRLTELADRASAAEGGTVRWGIALGTGLAVVGPLTVAVGALAKGVVGLAAALGTGLLPLIGVGGAVVVGLSALVAWFVKSRLEAAAMAKQVDDARRAFSEMVATASQGDLERELAARQRRLAQLNPELQRLRRSLAAAEQAGAERLAGSIRRQLQPLEREAGELIRQIGEIRARLDTLGTAGGGAAGGGAAAPVLRLTLDNLRRLDEALRKTRDRLAALRFEEAFEPQAEKAAKLREEIAATEERLRRLEAAARRAGEAFRLLSLPEPAEELAGAEALQIRGRPVPAERVAVAPAPAAPALGAVTRALAAFEVGLKDGSTSLGEVVSS
ncbi:MAG TPA: tape measure protein, partial [Longimicrobiales bacterium]